MKEEVRTRRGVNKVDVENENGFLTAIFRNVVMEKKIAKANQKWLQQADRLPLRKTPLQSLVGEQVDNYKRE